MWDTGDSVRDFWDTVWDSWVSRLDNAAREAEVPPSEKSIGCGRPRVGRGDQWSRDEKSVSRTRSKSEKLVHNLI